ncbi:MAG: hypothetical protein M3256_00410 [Actinomycetota bacterium]|nr:hypothetical protein [Actinomycetota bacterium]
MTDEDPDGYDLLPEKKLLLRLALPYVGEKVAEYLQDRREREMRRAEQFRQLVLDRSKLEPEEILERVATDERVEELFWNAMEVATHSSLEDKRKAAAGILSDGLKDDALVDQHFLHLRLLDNLDAPEFAIVRALRLYSVDASRLRLMDDADRVFDQTIGLTYRQLSEYVPQVVGDALHVVVQNLKTFGIVREHALGVGFSDIAFVQLTHFGRLVEEWVEGWEEEWDVTDED